MIDEAAVKTLMESVSREGSGTLTFRGAGCLHRTVGDVLWRVEREVGQIAIETTVTVTRRVQETEEQLDVPWDGVHRPMPGQTFSVADGVNPKTTEALPLYPDDPRAVASYERRLPG